MKGMTHSNPQAESRLSAHQITILQSVGGVDGVGALARRTHLNKSTVLSARNRLESRGLIVRRPSEHLDGLDAAVSFFRVREERLEPTLPIGHPVWLTPLGHRHRIVLDVLHDVDSRSDVAKITNWSSRQIARLHSELEELGLVQGIRSSGRATVWSLPEDLIDRLHALAEEHNACELAAKQNQDLLAEQTRHHAHQWAIRVNEEYRDWWSERRALTARECDAMCCSRRVLPWTNEPRCWAHVGESTDGELAGRMQDELPRAGATYGYLGHLREQAEMAASSPKTEATAGRIAGLLGDWFERDPLLTELLTVYSHEQDDETHWFAPALGEGVDVPVVEADRDPEVALAA